MRPEFLRIFSTVFTLTAEWEPDAAQALALLVCGGVRGLRLTHWVKFGQVRIS
jgi:hypothetical protein